MEAAKIREYTPEEITNLISEEVKLLANLRYNNYVSKIENPSRIRAIKRNIARMKTILNEKSTKN